MRIRLQAIVSVFFLVLFCSQGEGQVATGLYNYGTFDNKGFDEVNVGNLNVYFAIPILHKSGRGLPFDYNLTYNSSIYYPATVNGSQVWTPVNLFGWGADTEAATGFVSYSKTSETTVEMGGPGGQNGRLPTCTVSTWSNWVYIDPLGTAHAFNGTTSQLVRGDEVGCPESSPSFTELAGDGSFARTGLG